MAPSSDELADLSALWEGFDGRTARTIASFFDRFDHGRRTADRFDRAFRDIAMALRDTLSAAQVTIWIPNELGRKARAHGTRTGVLNPAYTSFPLELASGIPQEWPLAKTRAEAVIATGSARFDGSLDANPPPVIKDLLTEQKLPTMWSVPVRTAARQFREHGAVIAVAELNYPADASAGSIPVDFVELCGILAGRALERALWIEQELVIDESYKTLDVLRTDKHEAMDLVAAVIAESMQFEACTILLADRLTETLHVLGTTGIDSRLPTRRMRYPYGFSCSGRVARTKRILATEDLDACGHHEGPKFSDRVENPSLRQYLGAPIVSAGNELLGVIRLRNKRPPVGRRWPRCLNALDCLRIERTARVLAPLISLMIKDMQNASVLERVRHDMDMPATMIRDNAGSLQRMTDDQLVTRVGDVRRKLEDFESLAEILLLNSELLRVRDATRLPFEPEYIMPMGDFVAKLCKMLTTAARRRGLAGVLYTDESFRRLPRLWLDPKFMQIALYNLLHNAIKYSDDGELIVVEGGVRQADGETWYQIHVKNNGIGVAEEDAERIFERHYRAPKAVRRNSTGLGLGLAIARSMVERHGGHLVLSNPHKPTVFTIELPGSLSEHKPS